MSVHVTPDLSLAVFAPEIRILTLYKDLRAMGFSRRDANLFINGFLVGDAELETVVTEP